MKKYLKHFMAYTMVCVFSFFFGLIILAGITEDTIKAASSSPEVQAQTSGGYYGSADTIIDMLVSTAEGEIGNVGGQKFKSWYGFNSHWCHMFVSWCANQCGLIKAGIMPKASWCYDGIQFYKKRGQFHYTKAWGGNGYIPKRGDIIYFTRGGSGTPGVSDPTTGHVGIVTAVEGNKIHTVEGNTSNSVRRRNYDINNAKIVGYGTPDYAAVSGSYTTNLQGSSVEEQVWRFLRSKGFSEASTAGIMGNMYQESSMNPGCIESNGEGYGLTQWSFGRKQTLLNRANAAGVPWQDVGLQLNLLWDELNGLDSTTKAILNKRFGGLQGLMSTNDVDWAVEAFCSAYERPNKNLANMARRHKMAHQYYNKYAGK